MSNFIKLNTAFKAVRNKYGNNTSFKFLPGIMTQLLRPFCLSELRKKDVTFNIETDDGSKWTISGEEGAVLRNVIVKHPDKVGDTYGVCDATVSCSTCHVMFPESFFDFLNDKNPLLDSEHDVLDMAPATGPTSRLGCCVFVWPEMEGITIRVPMVRQDVRMLVNENKEE